MRDHVKILGILNIIMGCLTALIGIVALFVLGGIAGLVVSPLGGGDHDTMMAAPILVAIGFGAAIFFLILAAPAILGGWGLLRY